MKVKKEKDIEIGVRTIRFDSAEIKCSSEGITESSTRNSEGKLIRSSKRDQEKWSYISSILFPVWSISCLWIILQKLSILKFVLMKSGFLFGDENGLLDGEGVSRGRERTVRCSLIAASVPGGGGGAGRREREGLAQRLNATTSCVCVCGERGKVKR